MSRRRFVVVFAVTLLGCAGLIGCTEESPTVAATSSTTSSATWIEDRTNGSAFNHPTQWTFYSDAVLGAETASGYLSTEALHSPCGTTMAGGTMTISCAAPVDHLPPGGVLVTLGGHRGPKPQGPVASSGPATASSACGRIGGSYEVRAEELGMSLSACFAGTDTQAAQRQSTGWSTRFAESERCRHA